MGAAYLPACQPSHHLPCPAPPAHPDQHHPPTADGHPGTHLHQIRRHPSTSIKSGNTSRRLHARPADALDPRARRRNRGATSPHQPENPSASIRSGPHRAFHQLGAHHARPTIWCGPPPAQLSPERAQLVESPLQRAQTGQAHSRYQHRLASLPPLCPKALSPASPATPGAHPRTARSAFQPHPSTTARSLPQ